MAIDFSGYAGNYAGNAQTQAQAGAVAGGTLGGILGSIPNFQERFAKHRGKDIKSSTSDYMKVATGELDIDSFDLSETGYKDAASNYIDYKRGVEKGTSGKGGWFAKRAERKGLMGASDYIDAYNQEMRFVAPMVGKKIFEKYQLEHLTNDDMKEWIRKRGLSRFILDNFQADPNNPNDMNTKLREWAIPDETWRQWGSRKGGALGIGGTLTGAGLVGGFGITGMGGGLAANRMYQRYKSPTGLTEKDLSTLNKSAKKAGFGDVLVKKSEAAKTKKVGTSKSVLTKAKNKYAKAEKAYKGKNFAKTKVGKEIKATIDAAESGLKTANKTQVKSVKGMLDKAIARHGRSKVIRMVAEKLGFKGAVSLLAKTGLAVLPTGVGNVAGAAMLAVDAYMIYNILSDLAD
jgi:hypothetical protein